MNAVSKLRREGSQFKGTVDSIKVLPLAAVAFCGAVSAQTGPAPIGHPDSYDVQADVVRIVDAPGILGNDEAVRGRESHNRSALTALLRADVSYGSLQLDPDGSFVYAPAPGFTGTDEFTYIASDGVASSSETPVTLIVSQGQTAAPVALGDSYSLTQGMLLEIPAPGVLENDQKVTGREGQNRQPLSASLVTASVYGEVVLGSDGAFTYAPDPGFVGIDTFTYDVYDGVARSEPATVTVSVDGASANTAPPRLTSKARQLGIPWV